MLVVLAQLAYISNHPRLQNLKMKNRTRNIMLLMLHLFVLLHTMYKREKGDLERRVFSEACSPDLAIALLVFWSPPQYVKERKKWIWKEG
jgi:hypothetical protein